MNLNIQLLFSNVFFVFQHLYVNNHLSYGTRLCQTAKFVINTSEEVLFGGKSIEFVWEILQSIIIGSRQKN